MESISGRAVPRDMSRQISKGASEPDRVRSGLGDTMRMAFQEPREVMKTCPDVKHYRTAAYVTAISKIAQFYYDLGMNHRS